jgi:hypothetical protein
VTWFRTVAQRLDDIEGVLVDQRLANYRDNRPTSGVAINEPALPSRLEKIEDRFKPTCKPATVNLAPAEAKVYRSVPTEIRAIQWTGNNEIAIARFTIDCPPTQHSPMRGIGFQCRSEIWPRAKLWVNANQDWLTIDKGEWVAQDMHGFYPIKDDVFQMKYREVN